MAVLLLPVSQDAPTDLPQDMAGQVGNPHPGQDQKPGVVGEIGQMIEAGLFVPANEPITGLTTPSGGAEQQAGKGATQPVIHQILHVLAHRAIKAQVVYRNSRYLNRSQDGCLASTTSTRRGSRSFNSPVILTVE